MDRRRRGGRRCAAGHRHRHGADEHQRCRRSGDRRSESVDHPAGVRTHDGPQDSVHGDLFGTIVLRFGHPFDVAVAEADDRAGRIRGS